MNGTGTGNISAGSTARVVMCGVDGPLGQQEADVTVSIIPFGAFNDVQDAPNNWTVSEGGDVVEIVTPSDPQTVTIRTKKGGTAKLRSPKNRIGDQTCQAEIEVIAHDLASTEWVGVDPGDGKTNYEAGANPEIRGGGDRIFAERNQPVGRFDGGDELHDKIKIKATLASAPRIGENVTVFFKLLDPDHYSADTDFDPNAANAPGDNIIAGGTMGIGATLMDAGFTAPADSVDLVGDGMTKEVEIGLQITARQPCNNFKVVASCSELYRNSVAFDTDGKTLIVGSTGDVSPKYQTKLLTVWRTLYCERDRMGPVDFTQGVAPSRIVSGNVTAIVGDDIVTNQTIHAPGGTNQFENGNVAFLNLINMPLGVRDVIGNTTDANSMVSLSAAAPLGSAQFVNLEDDDIAHGITSADMAVDVSLWEERYDPVCVKVDLAKTDLSPINADSVNQTNVTFETNIGTLGNNGDERLQIRAKVKANKQAASTLDFWVVYQLGAFQGQVGKDNDPNTESPTVGVSSRFSGPTDGSEAGTIIYAETIRDLVMEDASTMISESNLKMVASVHEGAREFGLCDDAIDGPLMNFTQIFISNTPAEVDLLIFNGNGLKKIMIKPFPGE